MQMYFQINANGLKNGKWLRSLFDEKSDVKQSICYICLKIAVIYQCIVIQQVTSTETMAPSKYMAP